MERIVNWTLWAVVYAIAILLSGCSDQSTAQEPEEYFVRLNLKPGMSVHVEGRTTETRDFFGKHEYEQIYDYTLKCVSYEAGRCIFEKRFGPMRFTQTMIEGRQDEERTVLHEYDSIDPVKRNEIQDNPFPLIMGKDVTLTFTPGGELLSKTDITKRLTGMMEVVEVQPHWLINNEESLRGVMRARLTKLLTSRIVIPFDYPRDELKVGDVWEGPFLPVWDVMQYQAEKSLFNALPRQAEQVMDFPTQWEVAEIRPDVIHFKVRCDFEYPVPETDSDSPITFESDLPCFIEAKLALDRKTGIITRLQGRHGAKGTITQKVQTPGFSDSETIQFISTGRFEFTAKIQ